MPVLFVDLAQTCAPMVEAETLAGVVSLESRFEPFAVRVNSGPPLSKQPSTKAEAIEIATSLAAERQDVQLGLGGIDVEVLRKLKLSISDAFDPCLNLRATATMLDGYYRLAVNAGAEPKRAGQVMLQSWYGRGDPAVGDMVKYDEQVSQEVKRLGRSLATLEIGDGEQGRGAASLLSRSKPRSKSGRAHPSIRRHPRRPGMSSTRGSDPPSSCFQNSQMEQSE